MNLWKSITFSMIILMMLSTFSFLISKKSTLDINKSSPFECGFMKMSSPRISFSIQFFMIAIIFLMFDIELTLILPMISSFKMIKLTHWLISSLTILTLIIYGLMHEWMNGVIEWSK
uniref:NADH-ubiquinone oxidoreductase chain 3 n=1 Tax=Tropidocephala brunnipennis TaxID=2008871 RepID=A0A7S4YZG6_9HEMI|nr:NADH dehydrogenase subunit 3 [Tropidocephala brunnipennis]QBZ38049.1 NADH dehydrogenase subunit 3 [Tropidocephala brunnipennis]